MSLSFHSIQMTFSKDPPQQLQISICCVRKASGQSVGQPSGRLRVPLVPLKNYGKRMFSALFVLIISDVEEIEGLWVDASPTRPWGWWKEEYEGRACQGGKRVDDREGRSVGWRQ